MFPYTFTWYIKLIGLICILESFTTHVSTTESFYWNTKNNKHKPQAICGPHIGFMGQSGSYRAVLKKLIRESRYTITTYLMQCPLRRAMFSHLLAGEATLRRLTSGAHLVNTERCSMGVGSMELIGQ
jgi:hypothetical protein